MKIMILDNFTKSTKYEFTDYVNSEIKIIEDRGGEIIDIKYSNNYDSHNANKISVMIIYKW